MKKKVNVTLQSIIDKLLPYLRNIGIDKDNKFLPVLTIIIPIEWEVPLNNSNYVIEQAALNELALEVEIGIFNQEKTLDDLVDFVENDIIKYNEIMEQKQQEIEENIRRIQEKSLREIEEMKRNLLNDQKSFTKTPKPSIKENLRVIPSVPKQDREVLNEGVMDEDQFNDNIIEQPFIEPNPNKIAIKVKDLLDGKVDLSHMKAHNAELFERDRDDD